MRIRYITLCLALSFLLTVGTACTNRNGQTETESAPVTDAEPHTEDTQSVTEFFTEQQNETKEEETVMEAETESVPDGIFETVYHMSGFTEEKNGNYLKGEQCKVQYNEDGSFTLKGTWKNGERFSPAVTVSYSKMMSSCCPSVSGNSDLPNASNNEDMKNHPYRVVVFTVHSDETIAGDTNLYFSAGKKNAGQGTVLAIQDTTGKQDKEYLVYDFTDSDITTDYLYKLKFTWAWGIGDETNLGSSVTVYSIDLYHTVDEVWADKHIAPQTVEDRGNNPLGISADKLDDLVADMFGGTLVRSETVMFLDPGDEKSLLFSIDEVLSVKSYDNRVTYTEGVDYAVKDGKLVALKGGSLPFITRAKYYSASNESQLMTEYNGKSVYTHWGEGQEMTDWQVNVTYTHTDTWDGFRPACEASVYREFLTKLANGEDVTMIFYGDSCTYGAASSYSYGYAPYQKSYAMLFTETLAKLFDYTVHYVTTGKGDNCYVPTNDVVYGQNGTITFINPSVGGWTSADGVNYFDSYLAPFINRYGCDLFVLDIGGNDGSAPPENTRAHDETILNRVLELAPQTSVVIMSTMVPNPDSTNGWYSNEFMQEPWLVKCAEQYRLQGIPCAACRFTSMHLSVLDKINFRDITGNNINHPNDFLARIYTYTLIQTVIGYDNLD